MNTIFYSASFFAMGICLIGICLIAITKWELKFKFVLISIFLLSMVGFAITIDNREYGDTGFVGGFLTPMHLKKDLPVSNNQVRLCWECSKGHDDTMAIKKAEEAAKMANDNKNWHKVIEQDCIENIIPGVTIIGGDFESKGKPKILRVGNICLSGKDGIAFADFNYRHLDDFVFNKERIKEFEIKALDAFYAEAKRRINSQH